MNRQNLWESGSPVINIYTIIGRVAVPSQFLETVFFFTFHSLSLKTRKVVVFIDMFRDGRITFIHFLYFAIVRMANAESDICPLELGCIGHFVLAGRNRSDIWDLYRSMSGKKHYRNSTVHDDIMAFNLAECKVSIKKLQYVALFACCEITTVFALVGNCLCRNQCSDAWSWNF